MSENVELICFGELIWDMLPSGKVAGGAPFNIVNRANALGLRATVVGSVGQDELGDAFIKQMKELGNPTDYIQRHPELPSSVALVHLNEKGEASYEIVHPVAWDDIRLDQGIISLVKSCKALVYSSLALRDARTREVLFSLLPYVKLKICDINLRDGHFTKETVLRMMEHADIMRMNEDELAMICKWSGWEAMNIMDQVTALKERFNYETIIVTLGEKGAVCLHDSEWIEQPVFNVEIQDTVGSGDAFLAAFTEHYLNDYTIRESLRYACAVGALTASKKGGTPKIEAEEIKNLLAI